VSRDIEKLAKYKGISFEAKNKTLVSFTAKPMCCIIFKTLPLICCNFLSEHCKQTLQKMPCLMLAYTAAQILPASGQL